MTGLGGPTDVINVDMQRSACQRCSGRSLDPFNARLAMLQGGNSISDAAIHTSDRQTGETGWQMADGRRDRR